MFIDQLIAEKFCIPAFMLPYPLGQTGSPGFSAEANLDLGDSIMPPHGAAFLAVQDAVSFSLPEALKRKFLIALGSQHAE